MRLSRTLFLLLILPCCTGKPSLPKKWADGITDHHNYPISITHYLTDNEVKIWTNLANNGVASAAVDLSAYYEYWRKDFNLSLYWTQRAAALGDTSSQFNYGSWWYDHGKTTNEKDIGLSWLKLAAKQGHRRSKEEVEKYNNNNP